MFVLDYSFIDKNKHISIRKNIDLQTHFVYENVSIHSIIELSDRTGCRGPRFRIWKTVTFISDPHFNPGADDHTHAVLKI